MEYYVDTEGISHWICARCGEPIFEPDNEVKVFPDDDTEKYYHPHCHTEEKMFRETTEENQ